MTLYDTFSQEEKDNFNNNLGLMNEIIDFGNANGWDVYESLDTWAKRYFSLKRRSKMADFKTECGYCGTKLPENKVCKNPKCWFAGMKQEVKEATQ